MERWDFKAEVRGLVLVVQPVERTLVRGGLPGVLIPVLHYLKWGWKAASPVIWSKLPLQAVLA